jgi:hypothetical protein
MEFSCGSPHAESAHHDVNTSQTTMVGNVTGISGATRVQAL